MVMSSQNLRMMMGPAGKRMKKMSLKGMKRRERSILKMLKKIVLTETSFLKMKLQEE